MLSFYQMANLRIISSCSVAYGDALGRSLAPRLSTRFHTGLTADCTTLDIRSNTDMIQIRPRDLLIPHPDDTPGNADHRTVRRHFLQHNRTCSNFGIFSNGKRTKYFCPCADHDIIF